MERVVLVHGLWTPGTELFLLERRLGAAGLRPVRLAYRSVVDEVDESADRLARLAREMEGDAIHLVGHSLGGVVAVHAARSGRLERGGRIVCLGSPLSGSRSARVLRGLPGGKRLLGRSASLLTRTDAPPWVGPGDLGIVAGSLPLGLGMLLGGLPRPHDGVVSVDETRLYGATDHVVLPVSHFGMLWSRAVAEQVIGFLSTGAFPFRRDRDSAR